VKGLMATGGTARQAAVEKAVVSVGGTLEAYYFTFGATDAITIVDLPDNASAAALSLAVAASGLVRTTTTPLLTPAEIDRSVHQTVDYVPPGG